jgi:hypothetical protein
MKNDPSQNWWWNKFLNLDKSDQRRRRFDENEAAAFYYELARRNPIFSLKDSPPFTKLKRGEHRIVYQTFSRKFAGWKKPLAMHHVGVVYLHEDYAAFPNVTWNLRESKSALQKKFWEMIEAERNQRGISEPEISKRGKGGKSRNAGNMARAKGEGQPWAWLELMDAPHGLTSNERSHLSAARKKSREIKNDFLLLWKEIGQHRAFLERYFRENPQALQIDREAVKW